MLKKLLSLLLALALVFTFAACESSRDYDDDEDEDDDSVAETETEKETIIEKDETINFEEMVVEDNEDYTIIIKDINPHDEWGYTIDIYVENHTENDVEFTINNCCVNDLMCDAYFSVKVSPDKKANDQITIYEEELNSLNIKKVTNLNLYLAVYDPESWDKLYTAEATIYPYGADACEPFQRISTENEIVVVDNSKCTLILLGVDEEFGWGYSVKVYMHNKTQNPIHLYIADTAINDIMLDGWGVLYEVIPGKHTYGHIYWDYGDMKENGIEDVEKIWVELMVEDWIKYETLFEAEIEFAPF